MQIPFLVSRPHFLPLVFQPEVAGFCFEVPRGRPQHFPDRPLPAEVVLIPRSLCANVRAPQPDLEQRFFVCPRLAPTGFSRAISKSPFPGSRSPRFPPTQNNKKKAPVS